MAAAEGLAVAPLANGFAACADPDRLQEICDQLGPAHLRMFFERWMSRLPLPLNDADRAAARHLEGELDARFPQINGAGILLYSTATLLSDIERHDLGWFVACLCTPLAGEDLAAFLPRYRPPRCSPGRRMATSATSSPAGGTCSPGPARTPASSR